MICKNSALAAVALGAEYDRAEMKAVASDILHENSDDAAASIKLS